MSINNQSLLDSMDELLKKVSNESTKQELVTKLQKLKNTKVNILIVGATGSGKSSTINALFNTAVAKVGQGSMPETATITRQELNNVVLWDTPGLGDSTANDLQYKKMIQDKLSEKDTNGEALIDLVLYILDGTTRNLGTDYDLLKSTIIPALQSDKVSEIDRLIIAINKADQAQSGKHWNHETNQPQEKLVQFLEEKVNSTKQRLLDDTGITFEPIYYAAGFKEDDEAQKPYNIAKLYSVIAAKLKNKKRAVILEDKNRDASNFESNDGKKDYELETQKSVFDSFLNFFGNTLSELFSTHKKEILEAGASLITATLKFFTNKMNSKG